MGLTKAHPIINSLSLSSKKSVKISSMAYKNGEGMDDVIGGLNVSNSGIEG